MDEREVCLTAIRTAYALIRGVYGIAPWGFFSDISNIMNDLYNIGRRLEDGMEKKKDDE